MSALTVIGTLTAIVAALVATGWLLSPGFVVSIGGRVVSALIVAAALAGVSAACFYVARWGRGRERGRAYLATHRSGE